MTPPPVIDMRLSIREDRLLKRLEVIGGLLKVILWPVVAGLIVFYFGPAIKQKFRDSDNIEMAGPGISIRLQNKRLEAAAYMGAAVIKDSAGSRSSAATNASEIAAVIGDVATSETESAIVQTNILWVDDNPGNNQYEFAALRALGFRVHQSTSTEDALTKLRQSEHDLLISDIKREPNNRAGLELLSAMRQSGDHTPVVFYTGSAAPEQKDEAVRLGAVGVAADPQELLKLIGTAIPTP